MAQMMNPAEEWQRAQVNGVGKQESALTIDDHDISARHATVRDQFFTVLSL
jgi:hypothetical protein